MTTLSEQPSSTKNPHSDIDNCTVLEVVTGKFDPHCHNDNIKDLLRQFSLRVYNDPPGHYNWVCSNCGRVCFSEEVFFPCRDCFVTTRVVCRQCNIRWKLHIDVIVPTDKPTIQ